MNVKEAYNYELIEDYLEGLLDQKTSIRIQKLLMEDEYARSIAKGILILKQNFDEEAIEAYLDKVYNIHFETIHDYSKPKKVWIYWKVAAAIVILTISSLLIFQSASPSVDDIIEDEMATAYPISQNLRGPDSNISSALISYEKREYEKVIRLLKQDKSTQGVFTRALSHLYVGNYQEASKDLTKSVLLDSRYKEQSRWFLVLSYTKSNETLRAIETLREILEIEGHYKYEEAKKLLSILSESNSSSEYQK